MEASHVAILRKNLVYLKEHLEVGEVLDHLYQEGIFTQAEYNRCKQAGPDKCGTVLEMLMKKGEDGYKSLCVALDSAQPHVKQQLDNTSLEEGATNLLFVNKEKMEQQHRQANVRNEKIITKLKDEISTLKKELDTKTKELEAAEITIKEGRKRHLAELEEENKKYETIMKKESQEKKNVEEHMVQWKNEAMRFEEKAEQLEKALSDEKERYEAITGLKDLQGTNTNNQTEMAEVRQRDNGESCVFSDDSTCDKNLLMLLPCLHTACKPCIEHHTDQLNQGRLLCLCGKEFEHTLGNLPPDYVRRNEAAYNVFAGKNKICTYKDHKHEVDAATYCQECDDYLCLKCQNNHDEIRKNRGHSQTEIQKMEAISIQRWLKENSCQRHTAQELVLYDNTCKKPVCLLCLKGPHNQHDVVDLQFAYEKTTTALEEVVKNHQCQLADIRKLADAVEEHQTKLHQKAEDLERQVVSVHQDVAGKFLYRQKQLQQDIRLSLAGPHRAVQEKLKTVRNAEKSVRSTIDYIRRAMESTTKAEFISLSESALLKKTAEDLKIELPSDDTRDTRVRISFQGQKALEEIIEEFGCLATCSQIDDLIDSQPTIRALRWDIKGLTERLTLTSAELQNAREEMTETKTRRFQFFSSFVEKDFFIYILADTEGENDGSKFVFCPPMTYDRERVWWRLDVSEIGQELVNYEKSGKRNDSYQFQVYMGTCSRFSIYHPRSTYAPRTTRYWETHTRVQVNRSVLGGNTLEMGVVEEGQIDMKWSATRQTRSWVVCVRYCDAHQGLCTQVWREGIRCTVCLTHTLSNTPGTDVTLRYGCVLDMWTGRLAFIDIDRDIVLNKFDLLLPRPLIPMFSVHPLSDVCTINMKLVSGGNVDMTDRKKTLIFTALS